METKRREGDTVTSQSLPEHEVRMWSWTLDSDESVDAHTRFPQDPPPKWSHTWVQVRQDKLTMFMNTDQTWVRLETLYELCGERNEFELLNHPENTENVGGETFPLTQSIQTQFLEEVRLTEATKYSICTVFIDSTTACVCTLTATQNTFHSLRSQWSQWKWGQGLWQWQSEEPGHNSTTLELNSFLSKSTFDMWVIAVGHQQTAPIIINWDLER